LPTAGSIIGWSNAPRPSAPPIRRTMSDLPLPPRRLPLGRDGRNRPAAWGMWRLAGTREEAARLVHAALDHGINLLDTADIYGFDGSERVRRRRSAARRSARGRAGLRGRMVLATKGGIRPPLPYDQSPPISPRRSTPR
jgi:aryl-alcohol dehydrogenase-like predicted oxidoreductase